MTVSTSLNRVSQDGNGSATDIAIPFPFQSPTDLIVLETVIATGVQTTKTLTTHYTILGTPNALGHYDAGGTVRANSAFAATVRWTVYRDPARTQTLDLTENNNLPAEQVEAAIDYQTMLIQRVADLIGRSLRQPDGDAASTAALPSSVARANKYLSFDSSGNPTASSSIDETTITVSAFMESVLDDADEATARATLGASATTPADNVFRIIGSSDATKKLAFEVDGQTTGVTRTVTAQDLDGTMALRTTVAAYTVTDTLDDGVGLAVLSGASFALTLPAAASHTNREVTILHQGTSLTQVYTITGNAAETIIAPDGTGNTYVLYTNGERLRLKCNGTSWYVLLHEAITEWADVGVMTITGTTSDPTKPTTPDVDNVYWRREGNSVWLRYILQISSAAGAAAGSGNYIFALPTNVALDTTIITPSTDVISDATRSEQSAAFVMGGGLVNNDSTSSGGPAFYAHTTSGFKVVVPVAGDAGSSDTVVVGSSNYALNNAELSYNFYLTARAANWRR